jgi:hypothetical protein
LSTGQTPSRRSPEINSTTTTATGVEIISTSSYFYQCQDNLHYYLRYYHYHRYHYYYQRPSNLHLQTLIVSRSIVPRNKIV